MTALIVLTAYCLTAHCPPYMGTLLSLGLLSYFPLFSFTIVFVPIVPRALLSVSLGRLVRVAASVVYKPSLYCRRGLKPNLVYQSKCCCSYQTCVPLSSSISSSFGSSQGLLRLSLQTPFLLQDVCLGIPLQGTTVITKGASPL